MKDMFDAKVVCEKCDKEMLKDFVDKSGFSLRAKRCPECGDQIIHPVDLEKFRRYDGMRGKTYNVKLRIVGNSHAISIPKEIIDFMNSTHSQMRKEMDDMVGLCFEDFGRLSVRFFDSGREVFERQRGKDI